jgi:cullin 3
MILATHTQLVLEVTRLLAGRFPPKAQTIKKQIESLIERDYLERSQTERKLLLYVA